MQSGLTTCYISGQFQALLRNMLLSWSIFFFFFFCHTTWHVRSQSLNQGSHLHPLHLKHRVLTIGPPGKFLLELTFSKRIQWTTNTWLEYSVQGRVTQNRFGRLNLGIDCMGILKKWIQILNFFLLVVGKLWMILNMGGMAYFTFLKGHSGCCLKNGL